MPPREGKEKSLQGSLDTPVVPPDAFRVLLTGFGVRPDLFCQSVMGRLILSPIFLAFHAL